MNAEAAQATTVHRLLVVDDSRAMQAIIRRVLETGGFGATDIRTVATGEEALEALTGFTPHLIITDWHMPKMSGIEMLQTLRQTGKNDLAVGFVTTESSPTQLQQAQTNGAAFIIQKPFRDADLIKAVGGVLGGQKATSEGGGPTAVSEVRRLIQRHMPDVPFRVIEGETFGLPHLSAQNLLVLYVNAEAGAISAVAAANLPAICMLGGGAARIDPKAVRQAIQDNAPSEDMVNGAIAFFRESAAILGHQFDVGASTFKGANLVPQDFAKLRTAVEHAQRRVDYRLSVPGYGDGRFVYIKA